MFHHFVDKFNEAAKGRARIDLLGGPEVVPVGDQVNAVATGIADVLVTYNTHKSVVPIIDVASLSLLTPQEEREVGFFDHLDKAHNEIGLKVLCRAGQHSGFYIYTKDKVEKLSDLAGMKIRSHGGFDPILKKFDVNTINVSLGELYSALDQGVVDGAAFAPYAYDQALYEVVNYALDHPFQTAGSTYIYMNLDKFNGLPQDLQDLMLEVALETEEEGGPICYDLHQAERQRLMEKGLEYVKLSPEEAEEFINITLDARWEANAASGSISKEELETVKAMIDNR